MMKSSLRSDQLMQRAELLPETTAKEYLHDCGSIRRMLIASINMTKAKKD